MAMMSAACFKDKRGTCKTNDTNLILVFLYDRRIQCIDKHEITQPACIM